MSTNFTRATAGNEVAQAFSSFIKGKTVLITGGTLGGLGAEAAATLVKYAPKLVILTARTQAKIDETFKSIRAETPEAALRSVLLDVSSLRDVRRAAEEINAFPETVDVLIHNAAVAGTPLNRTEDGFTQTLATNHIGPFLLTKLLLPKMLTAPLPPRVVVVSSGAHSMCKGFRWDDPHYLKEEDYALNMHYGESKVLSILFASALSRKSGGRVEAFNANPGWVYTQLSRYLTVEQKKKMGFIDDNERPKLEDFRTMQQGIAPYLVAAFDPNLSHALGSYVDPGCRPAPDKVADFAQGTDLEDKMWEASELWIEEKFQL